MVGGYLTCSTCVRTFCDCHVNNWGHATATVSISGVLPVGQRHQRKAELNPPFAL